MVTFIHRFDCTITLLFLILKHTILVLFIVSGGTGIKKSGKKWPSFTRNTFNISSDYLWSLDSEIGLLKSLTIKHFFSGLLVFKTYFLGVLWSVKVKFCLLLIPSCSFAFSSPTCYNVSPKLTLFDLLNWKHYNILVIVSIF